MEWWNSFVSWLTSAETRPALFVAGVLVVSIVVSALIAASITKAAVRRLIDQRDREQRAAAIGALIDASTEASAWSSLTPGEQAIADRSIGLADIHLRLLPVKGAALAADWTAHQLAEMKRRSATFGYELSAEKSEFRDRLLEWQSRPGRAKRIFENDLERWRYETSDSEKTLIAEQDAWTNRQHREQFELVNSATARSDAGAAAPEQTSGPNTEAHRLIEDVAAMDVRQAEESRQEARDAG